MSLGDLVSRILLDVRADTSQAKAQLKELKGVQREAFQSQIDGVEAGNKSLDKWVGRLGQVGLAVGAVAAAFKLVEEHGHRLDLEAAAAGVSIQGLAKASMGLKTNMELLEHAARMNGSAFKLTQDQMETAERAMYVLEERGNSSKEVWAAIDTALTKGAIKPLEQFGIVIDKTGMQLDENGLKLDTYGQKQEALRRIMKALSETAKDAEGAQHDAADAMQVEIVKLRNFWDDMKSQLAQLVLQLTPVIKGLADAVSLAGQLVDRLPSFMKQGMLSNPTLAEFASFAPWDLVEDLLGGKEEGTAFSLQSWYRKYGIAPKQAAPVGLELGPITVEQGKKGKAGPVQSQFGDFASRTGTDTAGPLLGFSTSLGQAADTRQFNEFNVEQTERDLLDRLEAMRTEAMTGDWFKRLQEQQQKKSTFLESAFGPIENFNAYQQAFQMLTGSVTAGLDAWITGSMSAGAAIKKFIGDALAGIAKHMAIEALKHGAYAIGSFAFGDISGGAKHAAAAVAFGAGAAAAAVAAKAMGGSGGAQPSTGGSTASAGGGASTGGRGASGGGSGGPENSRPITVIIGEPFSDMSPRMRALRSREAVEKALRERDE